MSVLEGFMSVHRVLIVSTNREITAVPVPEGYRKVNGICQDR